MRFEVINKETGKVVRPYNYYFVINQKGELWTVNHDLTFTKADEKYEILSERKYRNKLSNDEKKTRH